MAKRARQSLITLTDEKGVDHDFEPLELFTVAKKSFALLQPVKGKTKNEVAIFRFTMDKKGNPKTFTAPTDEEFAQAIDALEADVEVDGDEGCGCCCDCGCEEPAPKKTAKKAAKKKAPAKKAAAKKKPAKKSRR